MERNAARRFKFTFYIRMRHLQFYTYTAVTAAATDYYGTVDFIVADADLINLCAQSSEQENEI